MSKREFEELFGDFSDDDDDYDDTGRRLPANNPKSFKKSRKETWKSKNTNITTPSEGVKGKDFLGSIKITKPAISSTEFGRLMEGKRFIKLEQLRAFFKKQSSDSDIDWATVGVIVNKINKTSANGNEYIMFKLNNLGGLPDVSLFLFGHSKDAHWKLPNGSVIALLNANEMGDKNNDSRDKKKKYNSETCSITIDDPNKLLVLGTSKEMNYCQVIKKDGHICNQVTRAGDEFCSFHVTSAYRKFTSQRSELQSNFSNAEPESLYFGNNFQVDKHAQIMLEMKKYDSTQMKKKKEAESDKLAKIVSTSKSRAAGNLQKFLDKAPSKGSSSSPNATTTSPPSAPKSAREILNSVNSKIITPKSVEKTPALARGYHKGQTIDLKFNRLDFQKSQQKNKAIEIFKNRNAVETSTPTAKPKPSNKTLSAILQRVNSSLNDSSNQDEQPAENNENVKEERRRLINEALQAKSINQQRLKVVHKEAMDQHFSRLEKKEDHERRLEEVKSLKAKTITCSVCNYTAQSQGEYCKSLGHEVTVKIANKRFFACTNCKYRLFTFDDIIPTQACKNCGGTNFEKTSVKYIKTETKLGDNLKIRGEEVAFLNSLK